MKMLAKMYRGQYRAVEEALESWKADHEVAMAVYDLEEAIRVCAGLDKQSRELVRCAFDAGFGGKIRNSNEIGRCIIRALYAGLEAWEALHEAARDAEADGFSVTGSDHIPMALAETRALVADFKARWPFIKRDEVDRGAKEIETGGFVTGEDLLREANRQTG